MMRALVFLVVAGLLPAFAPSPAAALSVSRSGTTITLSGSIVPGDHIKFREAMQGAKIVNLNSTGGNIEAATEIGRLIRGARMVTLVNGASANCQSACGVIFASGSSRHYVNASGVADHLGARGERGLGFHEGNAPGPSGKREQSGRASSSMINAFYEFGASGGASLVTKAAFNQMYYVSGVTALSLGIATSSSAP